MPNPSIKTAELLRPRPASISLAPVTAPAPEPAEIEALRSGAALVDRSYLGRLALSGPQAREALGALATNDIEGLQPGAGCFAACCTAKGRMLGEIRVLYTGDELLRIGQERKIPFGIVRRPSELLDAPALRSRGFFDEIELPDGTTVTAPGRPFLGLGWTAPTRVHRPGEDTDAVRADWTVAVGGAR